MKVKTIHSHDELKGELARNKNTYLLLYKKDSTNSTCAKQNIENIKLDTEDIHVYAADVSEVRDIHENYNVKSVPTLIEFESTNFKNVLKGCLDSDYYKSYFENIIYELNVNSSDKPSKRVTVYTTPTCPWCTTVKNFLRKHHVRYSEVNVASDQSAAQSMVSKSGQQGVPQTEINGEMVIGFDQAKLNRLLELKTN